MSPNGFSSLSLPPTNPLSLLLLSPKTPKFQPAFANHPPAVFGKTMTAVVANTRFRFKNLIETFTVDVQRAERRELNVPLIAPFTIATSRLEKVENVAIRIELSNGCVGWGEAPILPFVNTKDQPVAMAKAAEACEFLKRSPGMTFSSMLGEIGGILHGHEFASVLLHWVFGCDEAST